VIKIVNKTFILVYNKIKIMWENSAQQSGKSTPPNGG